MTREYKRVSEAKRLNIVEQRAAGHSYGKIAKMTKIKKSTVRAVCDKRHKHHTIANLPRSGRPVKLTGRQSEHLVEKMRNKECTTIDEIIKCCQDEFNITISRASVSRMMNKANLRCLRTIPKPVLTEEHMRSRLTFAEEHEHWTVKGWELVIFSDETQIHTYPLTHDQRVWTTPTEGLNPDLVVPMVHSEGVGLMIWSCISKNGVHDLVSMEGSVTGERYRDVLDDHLLPIIQNYFPDNNYLFQHDNSSIHSSHVVSNFLKGQRISVMEFPAKSPDLNPIEHFWSLFKRRLKQEPQAHNREELWQNVLNTREYFWSEDFTKKIQQYYKSMPKRIQAVIAANGGHTKY